MSFSQLTGGEDISNRTKIKKGKTIPLERVRVRLALVWFVGAGAIFLLLIIQSIAGKHRNQVQEIWGWALPTLIPTLSLMVTILGSNALEISEDEANSKVKRIFYVIAVCLSVMYLLLILADLVVEPFTEFEELELMKLSNLWLGPFQGLVVSALSVVFFSKRAK